MMQDAAIDKLSRLISDPRPDDKKPRRPVLHLQFNMEEGWFSLFLLATVVYSTIWSVQAAGWVDHLNVLTLTTALGLIAGLIASKQHRLPSLAVHLIAVALGLLIAFWQTAGAYYSGSTSRLVGAIHAWLTTALSGGSIENEAIFLLFITALGFILAYTSVWLVFRLRSPWLAVVANAVVLLINLSNIAPGYTLFLIVFLMAALLLLLRFNLRESVLRWRRQGLRYSDDLSWDVMQAGTLISIGILIFAWLLPWGYINDTAAQIWNTNSNPWVQLENTWNRVFSVNASYNPSNHGNFEDTLVLSGNPNLNHDIVFKVQSDDPEQYIESLSYSTYDGHGWSIGPTVSTPLNANETMLSETEISHPIKQVITVVNSPGEQYPYLFGSPQVASVSESATLVSTKSSDTEVAWLLKSGSLAAGQKYTAYSYVSTADVNSLRTVSLPANAPKLPSNYDGQIPLTYYDPSIVSTYTQLPSGLDPNIALLAKSVTAHASTMYDKAAALEDYFRTHFTYDLNIQVPQGKEPVSWFLFRSGDRGYCNYFATAFVVMARELGIPARVVVGYTNGTYDSTSHQDVIRGVDAHAWPQVYFAGYGWINFEPSASFSTFSRPLPGEFSSSSLPPVSSGNSLPKSSASGRGFSRLPQQTGSESASNATAQSQQALKQQVGVFFGGIVLLVLFACILFGIWWQRLFRRMALVRQIYGRILLMANWAGIELQRSQTPYESMHVLAQASPGDALILERLGDIYVRELWADPQSTEHPRHSGEANELPSLWKRLQPRLFLYVLRHPYFLRRVPAEVNRFVRTQWRRTRAHRRLDEQEL